MIRPILLKLFAVLLILAIASSERSGNAVDDPNSIQSSNYYQHQNNQAYYQYPFPYAFDGGTTRSSVQQKSQSTEISRDSYVEAAAGLGYGGNTVGGEPASEYHYQIFQGKDGGQGGYVQQSGYGGQSDNSYGVEESGTKSGSGEIGLLGLLGLLPIGLIKIFKLLPVFAPVLLPILPFILLLFSPLLIILAPLLFILKLPLIFILALPLLILGLPLLFILPVPVLQFRSLPGLQRINLVESILYRDDCIERISCEVSRIVSANGFSAPWMRKFIEKSPSNPKWIHRIARAAESTDCKEYKCGAINSMQETFNLTNN